MKVSQKEHGSFTFFASLWTFRAFFDEISAQTFHILEILF